MVHGDLKGVRSRLNTHLAIVLTLGQLDILVDDFGCPLIADFSLAIVMQNQDSIRGA